jgi:hypothetical protein
MTASILYEICNDNDKQKQRPMVWAKIVWFNLYKFDETPKSSRRASKITVPWTPKQHHTL